MKVPFTSLVVLLAATQVVVRSELASAACPCPRLDVTKYPYEADGGDTAEDTAEIQEALDDASACASACGGGAVVHIPPGEYLVARAAGGGGVVPSLTIGSGTVLEGEGIDVSVIKLLNGQPGSATVLDNKNSGGDSDIQLRRLTFDGNRSGNAGVAVTHSVKFTAVVDFSITECSFANAKGHGLILQTQTSGGLIDSSRAHHNDLAGFYVQSLIGQGSDTGALRFVGCESSFNGDGSGTGTGFTAFDAENVVYTGCLAEGNGKYGFHLDSARSISYSSCVASGSPLGFSSYGSETAPSWTPSEDIVYSGCVAKENGAGFSFTSSRRISLTGCNASENDGAGVQFLTQKDTRITRDFSMVGGVVAQNGDNGVLVRGAQYGAISGVVIMNNGLNETAPCNASTCDAIYIRGGLFTGSSIDSKNVMISGCQITDDPDVSEVQRFAVNSIAAESERIHVFATEVAGNHPPFGTPIRLAGPESEKANNPGDN